MKTSALLVDEVPLGVTTSTSTDPLALGAATVICESLSMLI